MGRPRIPDHIKERQGTLEKSRVLDHVEFSILDKVPELPELTGHKKEFFTYVCKVLLDQGLLTSAFIPDIEIAAGWYQILKDAEKAIAEEGYFQQTSTGYKALSPDITVMEKATKIITNFNQTYGLNLAYSQKIEKPQKKDKDELSDLIPG